MRHNNFNPSTLRGKSKVRWQKWLERADLKAQWLIAEYEISGKNAIKEHFDRDTLHKHIKEWLLDYVFHKKCAYCETPSIRWYPDMEHYRPKAGVTCKMVDGSLQCIVVPDGDDTEIEHPGYFWLAYEWSNLVPSCKVCNNSKGTQFPVRITHVFFQRLAKAELDDLQDTAHECGTHGGLYYLGTKALKEREDPLLLHPFFDEPKKHLQFGTRGIVTHKTDRGKASIQVYCLDDPDLCARRSEQQTLAYLKFMCAYNNGAGQGWESEKCCEEGWRALEEVLDGKTPYSAAALDYVNQRLEEFSSCTRGEYPSISGFEEAT